MALAQTVQATLWLTFVRQAPVSATHPTFTQELEVQEKQYVYWVMKAAYVDFFFFFKFHSKNCINNNINLLHIYKYASVSKV